MAPIIASFLTQVEDAICAEVLRLCGAGGEAYPTPDYLQLQAARRGRVAQGFDVTPDEMPAFVIEFIFSEEIAPGGQAAGGDYRHIWNAAVVGEFKQSEMGYDEEDPTPTAAEFYAAVVASADVLTRRVHRAMRSFAPTVTDLDYGETSSNVEIGIFRFVLRQLDDYAYQVQILFEVLLRTEDLS